MQLNDTEKQLFAPPAAPDFSRDNMFRCRGLVLFVNIPQIGFGCRKVDVSLVTNSVTLLLLL